MCYLCHSNDTQYDLFFHFIDFYNKFVLVFFPLFPEITTTSPKVPETALRGLAHVLLQAGVEATLVGSAAAVVVGAGSRRSEAPHRRALRPHGRTVPGLRAHWSLGPVVAFAAVELIGGRAAPVPAGLGTEASSTEAASTKAASTESSSTKASRNVVPSEVTAEAPVAPSSVVLREGRGSQEADEDDLETLGMRMRMFE